MIIKQLDYKKMALYWTSSRLIQAHAKVNLFFHILAMEHLANALHLNPTIQGITPGFIHHRLGLYANNVLTIVTKAKLTFPYILKEFETFDCFSKLKVNTNKCIALYSSLPKCFFHILNILAQLPP